ncbi:uncharacterized protein LOC123542126 [Mercenaria mercenaria]|uniref:uncharacterized protein LOC123542126 n=1 Tax=Mercenaria mercenaria TaxID=6596 RepID=UPI00234F0509|nr:uncharacterized protein LOC123542126 [Mercenaria mercenaria]
MHFIKYFFVVLIYLWNIFLWADANAMLKPTHRGMMWTRGSYNSAGYNYMGINCGGIGNVKKNDGKCGLCGDSYTGPRHHETGGKYATGAIADVSDRGQRNIYVKVLLNSNQGGYFEFKLCASNGTAETQACFDKHWLKISEGRLQGDEYTYYVHRAGIIPLTIEIPDGVYCDKCVLQWTYVTGNTFGRDEHGVGCLGCGHQETYVNCADITIKGWEIPITPPPPTTPIPTTMIWTTSTAAPTTTTTTTTTPVPTTQAPTTRAPSTTVSRINQITKVRKIKTTQLANRYATKQRRPVTDFDEGSRHRYARYPSAYASVPAPVPAPAQKSPSVVPASVVRSKSVNIAQNQLKAAVKSPTVVVKAPDKVKNKNVVSLPKKSESHKPANRAKKRSGPFKIPRPPRLSNEQIDALNNNKNIVPHHDPLQKYVKVGSSRIIAAVDFTTLRAQQVQTPPTIYKGGNSEKISKTSAVTTPVKGIPSGGQKTNSVDMFSSFGNEMMGSPINSRKINSGTDLMNEYSVLPGNTPKGSQQRQTNVQNRNNQNNMGSLLNEFTDGNTNIDGTRAIPKTFGIAEPTTKGPQGNRYFSFDRYKSLTAIPKQSPLLQDNNIVRTPTSKPLQLKQTQSQSSGLPKSSMYSGHQQLSQNSFMYNGKQQTYSPAHPNINLVPETDMFGSSVSQNSFGYNMPNQNSLNVGSVSRYGQLPNKGLSNTYPSSQNMNQVSGAHIDKNQNSYKQINQQNQHLNAMRANTEIRTRPTKTTKLPVIDTSTHRVKNKQLSENSAPWRKLALNPSSNMNNANLQDTPVNLFKNKERSSFKAPVVFERFTNYKVGGGRKKPSVVPKDLIKANQFWQQENVLLQNTGISNESFHLNTDIHSPQNYFGQDHYIAHDVEISNPAFGGPETQDVQSQLALNLGQHEIPQAEGGPQSYDNMHLNAALHSPKNYFPQKTANVDRTMPRSHDRSIPEQQHIGIHNDLNIEKLFVKASATKIPTTIKQAPTTSLSTTTKPATAHTTDALDYQMQELKKLREKMERLQKLIEMRKGGFRSESSTINSPTQSFKDKHSQQGKSVSQATIDVPRSFNKQFIYTNQQNINSNTNQKSQQNVQNTNFQRNNHYMPIANGKLESNEMTVRKPSTVPPGMSKETTKYINHFKTQMLQSIKKANTQKKQQLSPTPASTLRNKKNDIYNIKPYNMEKTTYVTPSIRANVQRSEPSTVDSQSQPQMQRVHRKQKSMQTNTAATVSPDQDRREKYRRLLELLIERRKQKQLAAKQEQQNKFTEKQQHSSQQYNTNKQKNIQYIKTQQQQKQMSNNYDSQNRYQQSFQQKPIMAEIQTQSVKKQRIVQDKQTTSIRPVETIQAPNTAASISNVQKKHKSVYASHYKPNAVKTTIDKLADRLAAGMTEKLSSAGHNFHVLPLSSDSVMSALRDIAANVLKSQNDQSHLPQSANSKTDISVGQKQQPFEKPLLSEMQVTKRFQKQKTRNANDLTTTEVNRNGPVTTAAKHTTTKTAQRHMQSGRNSYKSMDKLARRQELIRKMKEMMLRRRQKLKMNTKTKTDHIPAYMPKVKPPHSGQRDMVNNAKLQSRGDISVHNIAQANNIKQVYKYNDPSTTTKNYSPSASYNNLQQTSQHTAGKSSSQIPATSSASSESIYSNNKPTVDTKSKLRLTPDIARAMLSRVRNMLARKNSQTGGSKEVSPKSVQGMSTKDVLVMPLKRETLYKLLHSMRKQKVSTGR